MRLASFVTRGSRRSYGIVRDDGIVDLGHYLPHGSLAGLVAAGAADAARALASTPPDHAPGDVRLAKPLDTFSKCLCVGVNYPDRNAEYRDASDLPAYPSLFVRFPESFVGPDEPLLRPPESHQLDYEGEIALVIGKAGRRIPAAAWTEHVLGFTLANEGTIRDWVRHGKFNVTPGKNWPGSGSLGPWITTLDEAGTGPFRLVTRVNGAVRQEDTTDRMMFPFGRILEYVSTFCTLEPGDVILTGTPTGSGARLDPPVFLAPGDVVEVEATGLGRLVNPVADEVPGPAPDARRSA
ncbi:MAG: fumarylacetoacetate hydrolase family protein [Methylobacteriaceae bacterium]|nr:fumarylacetoacetate hydrolase family protein [Methylobacteriaceae bacterium]